MVQAFVLLVASLITAVVVLFYYLIIPFILDHYNNIYSCFHLFYGHYLLIMICFHYFKAVTTKSGTPSKVLFLFVLIESKVARIMFTTYYARLFGGGQFNRTNLSASHFGREINNFDLASLRLKRQQISFFMSLRQYYTTSYFRINVFAQTVCLVF